MGGWGEGGGAWGEGRGGIENCHRMSRNVRKRQKISKKCLENIKKDKKM